MGDSDDLLREIRELLAEAQPETPITPPDFGAQLAEAIRRAIRKEQDDMTLKIPPARFDWTMNLGQVLSMITLALGLGGTLWHFSNTMATMQRDIEAGNARAIRYVPVIDSLVKSNDVQDERIQNVSVAVSEIRRQNAETSSLLGNIREDLATIKARLNVDARPR